MSVQEWAEPIRKVTALITRRGPDRAELLVFEHPAGVIQVPAGTVDEGESFEAAARREAWEETGALGLQLVREIGRVDGVPGSLLPTPRPYADSVGALACDVTMDGRVFTRGWRVDLHAIDGDDADVTIWGGTAARVPTRSIARAYERALFHFHCTVEMPSEWYVVTPDGQGVTWRCHWIPLDSALQIVVESQREWVEAAHEALIEDPAHVPAPRPPLPPEFRDVEVWETFLAPPHGPRRTVAVIDPQLDADTCNSARGLCVTDDGLVVVVQAPDGRWERPGGGREAGETVVDTLVREVDEEACATVTAVAYLAAIRVVELDERGAPSERIESHAQFWARVEIGAWEPQCETIARQLVPPTALSATMRLPFLAAPLLDRAVLIDPALDWPPVGEP